MKPQPRGGGDTTSCYRWHLPTAAAVPGVPTGGPGCPLPARHLFYGVQLPDAVGRKGDACLSLSGSAVPKSLPQAPVQQPVILMILPLRGQR